MTSSPQNAGPAPGALMRAAMRLVTAMRLGIVVVTLHWLIAGKPVWFMVGALSAMLSFGLAAVIQDPVLRAASSLCVTALLFAHIVFGMQAGLYETSAVFDKLMHLFGCGAIAGLVATATSDYCARKQVALPTPLLWGLAVGIVVSLGTLWEVFEFAIDRTGLFQAQKGLTDTMLDLVADVIGALATVTAFIWMNRRKAYTLPKGALP
ncbi:MAG: hypothetical protein AAGF14_02620 [Pseudomonadota bacterium]